MRCEYRNWPHAVDQKKLRPEHTALQISGGDAGWGWNAEAAKRNAANYQWNGDEMLFQIGTFRPNTHFSRLALVDAALRSAASDRRRCAQAAS